ncbi:hypothetical protein E2C01_087354 [Portunus trituberculatus]|uniref:Uncharacterized protein n=1 Tax=Portunus trituberculatus TaxID=210409 RepID=A0A5B7JC96_PORTR|nr:hypothetical protein [Portunus trituberculatus]
MTGAHAAPCVHRSTRTHPLRHLQTLPPAPIPPAVWIARL